MQNYHPIEGLHAKLLHLAVWPQRVLSSDNLTAKIGKPSNVPLRPPSTRVAALKVAMELLL